MNKTLIVFHDNHSRSGATASMFTILKNIVNDHPNSVHALVPSKNGDLHDKIISLGVKCHTIKHYPSRYTRSKSIYITLYNYLKCILKNIFNLILALVFLFKSRKEGYKIVYSNTTNIYFGFFYAFFSGAKHIWHFREFGIEDQNAYHICGERLFYKISYKYSAHIIAISNALYYKIIKFTNSSEKISVIYNDIDSSNIFFHRKNFLSNNSNLKILITGTINENKGQILLIKALHLLQLKEIFFDLYIAGNGDPKYLSYLKEQVLSLKVQKNVYFLGFCKDMNKVRESCDIATIGSTSEAFGRVTIEGMLSGLVIIASDSGANTELVKNFENGFLFKNNDPKSLAEVLEYIYFNRDQLEFVTNTAYKYAETFTLGNSSKKIISIISDLY